MPCPYRIKECFMNKAKITNFCDRIIEGCFYSLLVAVTFSTSLVEIASSLMILAWVVKMILAKDRGLFSLVPVKLLLVYFLWVLLSCINSDYFNESFRGVFKVVEYSLLFIISATSLNKETTLKRLPYILGTVAVIMCVDGFVQHTTGIDLIRGRTLIANDYMRRISASFVHPNDFGVYLLVLCLVFTAFIMSKSSHIKIKLVNAALFVLASTALFFTRSRGALLSFAAAFLVFGAMKAKKVLAAFIAFLLVIFLLLPYTAQERIFDISKFQTGGTTWERLMLWKGTINMIKVHPILGFGVNSYSRNFPAYKPPEYPDVRYSHNCYLHMASEIGIPGALIFIIFLVSVLLLSLKGIMSLPEGRRRDLASGLFAGMIGFAMNCVVDTHLYSVNLVVFFHLMLGYCYALSSDTNEK